MTVARELPHFEVLGRLLEYEPSTGRLLWNLTKGRRMRKGKCAGTIRPDGYIRVGLTIDGRQIAAPAHRIAWVLFHRSALSPNAIIDHINMIKNDNRISNLRLVNSSGNRLNSPDLAPSGGVQNCGSRYAKRPYRARIMRNGKRIHLGNYSTNEEARSAYENAASTYGMSVDEYRQLVVRT